MNEEYNWWLDPKNQEEVERISWWNNKDCMEIVDLPIAVVKSDDGWWVATTNEKTKSFLGEGLHGCAQDKTKEGAINKMFELLRFKHEYLEECRLKYQRWVPFRKGAWGKIGGNWFSIYGIHFYFRYGKPMIGGWYFPFTKLNISIRSEWASYRNWKQKRACGV